MSCVEIQFGFGVSVVDALATLDHILGLIARGTPTRIDDRILAYVQALRKSPELVALLEADFGGNQAQAFNPAIILLVLKLIQLIRGGGSLMEIIGKVIDLIGKFGVPGLPTNPSGYTPNDVARC